MRKNSFGCTLFLILLILVTVSIYNSCEAQIEVNKLKRQTTGRKIMYIGTALLVYNVIYYSGPKETRGQLPKYSPAVGAGVMGLGMAIEISGKKNKKVKKRI